jgi:hypothetical protein
VAKGIFDSKAESGDDDEIIARYHFPRRYLKAAEAMVGDWIAYREPATGAAGAVTPPSSEAQRRSHRSLEPCHPSPRCDIAGRHDASPPLRLT